MDWEEEPATQQQLFKLHEYGFTPTCPLSVTQAARLIRQYSRRVAHSAAAPSAPASTSAVRSFREEPASIPKPLGPLSDGARVHAHQLRLAVEAAGITLKNNPNGPNVRADYHSCVAARKQFWLNTCRDDKEIHAASPEVLDFYLHFGSGFFTPVWSEVEEVLEALDAAMPEWDKAHPELFYKTLKLNFPSRIRQR